MSDKEKVSGEEVEVFYECREIGEGDWTPCDLRHYTYCQKRPEMDTRAFVPLYQHTRIVEALRGEVERLKDALETESMRLAACGVAALGYFEGCKDEYDSASLRDVLALRAQLAQQQVGEYGDAYQGAREDLAIWKRRALEAEEKIREQDQIIDNLVLEAQGETRMGEPYIDQQQGVPEIPYQWSKSLGFCWAADADYLGGDWIVGTVDEDGNRYEVLRVEASQYDAEGESQKIAEAIVKLWDFAATPAPARCEYCDGTGDVHGLDGEWKGGCVCPAGRAPVQAEPSSPWVAVTERLPEPETDVLVRGYKHNSLYHTVAGLFHGGWYSQETEDPVRFEVVEWAPLPPAPEVV